MQGTRTHPNGYPQTKPPWYDLRLWEVAPALGIYASLNAYPRRHTQVEISLGAHLAQVPGGSSKRDRMYQWMENSASSWHQQMKRCPWNVRQECWYDHVEVQPSPYTDEMYGYVSGESRFELLRIINILELPAIDRAVILKGTGKISRSFKINCRIHLPWYLPFVSRCDKPHLSR